MTPWLAKNVVDTGNPVYPLAYRVFGGRDWDAAREAQVDGRPRPEADLGRRAGRRRSSTSPAGPTGNRRSTPRWPRWPSCGARSRRLAWALWGYVAYLFLTWWLLTHRLDRFWLPLLPALAVLAGLGADWTREPGVVDPARRDPGRRDRARTSRTSRPPWPASTSGPATSTTLRTEVPAHDSTRRWPGSTPSCPPDAKVLLVGQAAVFHLNHPIVYNTVFNDETFETLARGRSPAEVRRGAARAGHHPRLRRLVRDRALPLAGQLRVHPVRHARGVRRAGGRGRARTGPGDRERQELYLGTLSPSAEVSWAGDGRLTPATESLRCTTNCPSSSSRSLKVVSP